MRAAIRALYATSLGHTPLQQSLKRQQRHSQLAQPWAIVVHETVTVRTVTAFIYAISLSCLVMLFDSPKKLAGMVSVCRWKSLLWQMEVSF
jgi:hypothetical protein